MAIFRGTGGAGDSTTDASLSAIAAQSASATAKAQEAEGYRNEALDAKNAAIAAEAAAINAYLSVLNISQDFEKTIFKSNDAPTGSDVDEGDIWYDLNDNQFKLYREVTPNFFAWVPIIVGAQGGNSDTLDAGSF